MKKVDVIARLLEAVNHPIVHEAPVVRQVKGKAVTEIKRWTTSYVDDLLGRSRELALKAVSVNTNADGYSSMTQLNGSPGGGKGGRQTMGIKDGDEVDWVPTSSTEVAALNTRHMPDPVLDLWVEARGHLEAIAAELVRLRRVLDRADKLQARTVREARLCAVAAGYEMEWADEWDVRAGRDARLTDFAGQLAEPLPQRQLVCKYVYKFVHNHHRLPERAEMLEYLASKDLRS